MLEVTELQQLPLLLFGRKAGIERPHGGKQGPQAGQGGGAVGFGLVFTARDQFQDLPEQRSRFIGAGLDGGFVLSGQPLLHPLQAGHRLHAEHIGGEPVVERGPLPCFGQPLHLAQQGSGRFEPFQRFGEFIVDACHSLGAGSIGLSFILGLDAGQDEVFFAVVPGCAEQLPPGSGSAGCLGQQQVVPAGRIESMPGLPRFQKFIQLAVVVGQGAEKIVDVQDGIPGGFVAAALAVEVCKGAEIRVGIGLFQRFGQRRRAQGRHTAGVGGGKVRRDIERLEVLAQKVQAERINGADGGALQQHPLAAQGRVAGFGLTAAEQCLPDAGPQLGCGRVRKGDDEQSVGVDGAFRVGDEPNGAFGQHRRLAAARSRTDQQRTAPVVDGGLLGGCPFGFTHGCSSFPSSGGVSGTSKGLAGASSARSPMPFSWQQMKL